MISIKKYILLFFLILSAISFADKPKKMVFVGARDISSITMNWYSMIIDEALSRLGIDYEYKFLPAKRASFDLNDGLVDGDLARVETYKNRFTNTIKVEEFINIVRFSAFSLNPNIKINGWKGFKGTDYRVDYNLGVMIAENNLSKYVAKDKLKTSPDAIISIKKLFLKRVDVYVGNSTSFWIILKEMEKQGQKPKEVFEIGVMQEIKIYPYLHKKHADLAPEIANELRKMKAEGVFEEITKKAGLSNESVVWKN